MNNLNSLSNFKFFHEISKKFFRFLVEICYFYFFVIIFAIAGLNVFLVLACGIGLAGIVGLIDGSYNVMSFVQAVGDGMAGMFEMSFLAILIAGMVAVIKHNGGFRPFA